MSAAGKRIAVFADDARVHEVLCRILAPLHCEVAWVPTAQFQFESLHLEPADLAVVHVDLESPEAGIAVLATITDSKWAGGVAVVTELGHVDESDYDLRLSAGCERAESFLNRAVEAQAIRDLVRRICESEECGV